MKGQRSTACATRSSCLAWPCRRRPCPGSLLRSTRHTHAAPPAALADVGAETLQNCSANVERNAARLAEGQHSVRVRELDWTDPPDWLAYAEGHPPMAPASQSSRRDAEPGSLPGAAGSSRGGEPAAPQPCHTAQQEAQQRAPAHWWGACHPLSGGQAPAGQLPGGAFGWRSGELESLRSLGLLLAADVIYDNDLTEAFMRTAVQLMRFARHAVRANLAAPTLLVALERRVNFTLHDLDARAPAYDYWRSLFTEAAPAAGDGGTKSGSTPAGEQPLAAAAGAAAGIAENCPPGDQGQAEGYTAPFPLLGRRVDLAAVPQRIEGYKRNDYLELWELWLAE